MDAVYGDLFTSPLLAFDRRNGNSHFYKFLFPYGQIGVKTHDVFLPRVNYILKEIHKRDMKI